ncbi:MAG: transcriptional regulator [Planctomycetes bacterium]|nr:transcriptional regulator [Planctomycetota bacterium]
MARTPTRDRILDELKTQGPQTATDLACTLGITPMAVRQHLYLLENEGLVAFKEERRRVGRPARVWGLGAQASGRFPNAHGPLSVSLMDAAKDCFGREGVDQITAEHTRRCLASFRERIPGPGALLEERVARLAGALQEAGYMAQWAHREDGSFEITENHCPVFEAAHSHRGLCGGEMALFQGLLGDAVHVDRTEYIMDGSRRCVYRLVPLPVAAPEGVKPSRTPHDAHTSPRRRSNHR